MTFNSTIDSLVEKLNLPTRGMYDVTKWARGDWSLYEDGVLVVNTRGARSMESVLRSLIRGALED